MLSKFREELVLAALVKQRFKLVDGFLVAADVSPVVDKEYGAFQKCVFLEYQVPHIVFRQVFVEQSHLAVFARLFVEQLHVRARQPGKHVELGGRYGFDLQVLEVEMFPGFQFLDDAAASRAAVQIENVVHTLI